MVLFLVLWLTLIAPNVVFSHSPYKLFEKICPALYILQVMSHFPVALVHAVNPRGQIVACSPKVEPGYIF